MNPQDAFPNATESFKRRNPALFGQSAPSQPPAAQRPANAQETGKAGKPRLKQDRRGMNKTEAEFFGWLHVWKSIEPITNIRRETLGFRLANGVVYWPDFTAETPTQLLVYEVKGFMREDAAAKVKIAASMFPRFTFFLATKNRKRDGGGWNIERVMP